MNPVAEVLYEEAIRLVSRHRIATCSFLQRQLKIGHADARTIVAKLQRSDRIPLGCPPTVDYIAKNWCDGQADGNATGGSVKAAFFDVDSGISFDNADLYCALIGSKDAGDVNVAYGKACASGSGRALAVATAIFDSIGDGTQVWPSDGIVLKITSDPKRLLGCEVKQICSEFRTRANQDCIIILGVQYDDLRDDLVLEVIASRINS